MSTYESRLKQRKAQFIERAQERLALTRTNVELLGDQPQRSDLWQSIMKDFHQLAAAAGIYEMSELCSLAVDTEDRLVEVQKHGLPGKSEIDRVLSAIGSMDEILRALRAEDADSC